MNNFSLFGVFVAIFFTNLQLCMGKCSWETCTKWKPGMLNVHIIPHSHDDAGWLKTADQYFWGSKKKINYGAVKYTYDTVISELQRNPRRKFAFCETNFFWKWWMQQHDFLRHQVRKLMNDGQMEFVGGGWVQNDEATAHYTAIIDQMTLGLRKLNETFGKCGAPKVAWQIDPFGHTREQAALFAQMGMDGLMFSRLHYLDHMKRKLSKTLETVWKGSGDLGRGKKADLFTSVMFQGYGPPPGFCFDAYCNDDPIMDDDRLEGYNLNITINAFLKWCTIQVFWQLPAKSYTTSHILIPFGGDFAYTNAAMWFDNIDKLIEYSNERQSLGSKVNVIYSTPACYLTALNQAHSSWTTKSDDFLPYASKNHSYWTGFYTSRPSFKGMIRQANGIAQLCKQLDVNAHLGPADFGDLEVLEKAMGITQHHDAVTGTARQNVTYDYMKRISVGIMEGQQVVNDALQKLIPLKNFSIPKQHFCILSNVSICNISQTASKFTVTAFNAQGRKVETMLRIPVSGNNYGVTGPDGTKIKTQIVKTPADQQLRPLGPSAAYEIVVPVTIPPMGLVTCYITKSTTPTKASDFFEDDAFRRKRDVPTRRKTSKILMKNDQIELKFNTTTGLLQSFRNVQSGKTVRITQSLYWYRGAIDTKNGHQASGAYIFRPNGTIRDITDGQVSTETVSGPLVQEVRQIFSPWAKQVYRLYKGQPYAELEWTIGPIPFKDGIGKEIVSRFDTKIKNNGIFYTDSNGRQILKRVRNHQDTYPYDNSEPVSGNYYPVTSHISIKDDDIQMAIMTDRSQGGSSAKDGSIELMIHRRLFHDDGFGVGEALNETGTSGQGLVVRGKHWLVLTAPNKAHAMHKPLAKDIFYRPPVTYALTDMSFTDYRANYRTNFSGLQKPLPPNVNLLTVTQWQAASILLRLEHMFQKGDDAELSKPVTISLKDLFTTYDIVSAEEMNLAANQLLNMTHRMVWKTPPDSFASFSEEDEEESVHFESGETERDLNRWETRQSLRQRKRMQVFRI